ncbi:hypothetical protein [uncultured Corynebacterium sp.]|uniref:hypothetical protein n=1 Tax=uncultured Corynebacterium sp. TaxID=159447 RepID=UPI0028D04588|nr:hypothetical protein [uncultured Corynebacterium sp.]
MTSKNDLGVQERDQHDYDDHRRPLVRALRLGSSALLVVTIVSLMSWGGYQGLPGIWGVLIGAAIAGGFLLVTVASVLLTASTTPTTTGAVVLGTWLMKVIVVLMVLVLIRDLTFYSHVAFFVTLLVALIVVLATEAYGVITSRVTYLSA